MSDKDEKRPDSGIAGVLNVIPAVYYDLIARVSPGAAFWIALAIDPCKPLNLENISTAMPGNVFIIVFLGYLTGMILTGVSIVWDYASLAIFRRLPRTAQHGLGLIAGKTLLEQWKVVADNMDAIDHKSPEAGRTVSKALAEVTLCQNLLSGLLMLICIGWISQGTLFMPPSRHFLPLLLMVLALFLATIFRQAMFLGRVETLHGIHVPSGLESTG